MIITTKAPNIDIYHIKCENCDCEFECLETDWKQEIHEVKFSSIASEHYGHSFKVIHCPYCRHTIFSLEESSYYKNLMYYSWEGQSLQSAEDNITKIPFKESQLATNVVIGGSKDGEPLY